MKTRSYLALIAAIILVPLLVLSGLGANALLRRERDARIAAMHEAARAMALAIDQEIARAEGALSVLAHSKPLEAGARDELYRLMRNSVHDDDTWGVLIGYDGQILVNTLVPWGTPLPQLHYSWIQPVIEQGALSVSNYRTGTLRQKPVISVDMPVMNVFGERQLLSQIISAERFNQLMSGHRLPPSWVAGVFGSDGISIARNKDAGRMVGKPVASPLMAASAAQHNGLLRQATRDGTLSYIAFAHTARTPWTVVIAVPVEEIEDAARRVAWYAMLGMVLTLTMASLLIFFLARHLTRGVEDLARDAKALGRRGRPIGRRSHIEELSVLQQALVDASQALAEENVSRQALERERERLLKSEHEARELAEQQNRAKDDFLAMLGHELRNPLAAITSSFIIMEAREATADQLQAAHRIGQRQAQHLARIVDDLLDVGRIMAGKISLQPRPLALRPFLSACVQAQLALGESHQWQVELGEVWVHADPDRLEQVFGNVLGNAVKYTPPGGTIHMSCREEGGWALIEISDDGIGMSPELLPQIFDVFVQGPTSIDRSRGGLGLGLALVRQLVELHGGSVQAYSQGPGHGSRFLIRLPACKALPVPALREALPPAVPTLQSHILLVEDNEDGRLALSDLLSLQGYRVTAVANGEDALAAARACRPDLALVDIGLPGMDGYQLAACLRAQFGPDTPYLIALTGYGLDSDRERALQAGFAEHLKKPFALASLLQALRRAGKTCELTEDR